MLMSSTCFAIERGDRLYGDLYFETAKVISKKSDTIIESKMRLKAKDGSYLIYTYEINRNTEEMIQKSIELFNIYGKSQFIDENPQTYIYSHNKKGEQLGQDMQYEKTLEYIDQKKKN